MHVDRLSKKQRSAYKKTENRNGYVNTAVKGECKKYDSNADIVITSKRSLRSNLINKEFSVRYPQNDSNEALTKKAAFTLAEVLITLGIIGVVAALTIPTLIGKYQKLVWVAQLQKSYNTASNSFKQTMAIDEVTEFTDTEFYKWFNFGNYFNYMTQYEKSEQILKKYFKIVKFVPRLFPEYNETSPVKYFALDRDSVLDLFGPQYYIGKLTFADGSDIHISFFTNTPINSEELGYLWIDVNGRSKGPNMWGRDFFVFDITRKGQLKPVEQGWGCDDGRAYGIDCGAKIIKDGWKMKY